MKETNIVALEIGSSKIKGAVGSVDPAGVVTVSAVEEESFADWVRYGVVSNAEEVAHHASNLLDRLEARCSGAVIQGVYVAIGGRSLRADAREKETILPHEMEITPQIIEQLMNETAATVAQNRELLDVVPRGYIVDKTRVAKPIGSLGSSVRMLSNVITCRPQLKRNLCHLLNEKLSLDILGFEVRQIAEADLVLTPEDRRLGCLLADCGAETTTVSIYKHGHLQYLATLPIGSRNITRDLTHLNMLEERAEDIKVQYGNAYGTTQAPADPSIPDMASVNKFVAARAGEIIVNIKEQIKLAGLQPKDLPAGIVLVGRGAQMADFGNRLSDATGMRVRYGSSVRSDLRVTDPRILLSDSADVLATLYAAARHNPQECLDREEVKTAQPSVETARPETATVTKVNEEKPEETKTSAASEKSGKRPSGTKPRKSPSFFKVIGDRIAELMSENQDFGDGNDDDNDDIMKDDED